MKHLSELSHAGHHGNAWWRIEQSTLHSTRSCFMLMIKQTSYVYTALIIQVHTSLLLVTTILLGVYGIDRRSDWGFMIEPWWSRANHHLYTSIGEDATRSSYHGSSIPFCLSNHCFKSCWTNMYTDIIVCRLHNPLYELKPFPLNWLHRLMTTSTMQTLFNWLQITLSSQNDQGIVLF